MRSGAMTILRAGLHRWHRRLGVLAAVPVVVLAVSGALLSHAPSLGLDRVPIPARLAASLYPEVGEGQEGRHQVTTLGALVERGGDLFLDGRAVARRVGRLLGAAPMAGDLVAVGTGRIVVLSPAGDLLEEVDAATLPAEPDRVASAPDGRLMLGSGDKVFATSDLMTWNEAEPRAVRWKETVPGMPEGGPEPEGGMREVSLQRLLIDIHTGRVAGSLGVFVMDAAAILLLALSFSGAAGWYLRRPAARRRP